jgi:hypothetical protein
MVISLGGTSTPTLPQQGPSITSSGNEERTLSVLAVILAVIIGVLVVIAVYDTEPPKKCHSFADTRRRISVASTW